MKLKPTEDNILFFAFRYALGRRSTAPGIVADYIVERWGDIPQRSQEQMKEEITRAIERNFAGDQCDVETWQKILIQPITDEKAN